MENRRLLSGTPDLAFEFRPAADATPENGGGGAAVVDFGRPYALHKNADARYGWTYDGGAWRNTWTGTETRPDGNGGERSEEYATLGHRSAVAWEMDVPNGTYDVRVVAGGKAGPRGEPIRVAAEGQTVLEQVPTEESPFADQTLRLDVTDGRLTLTAPDGIAVTRLVSVRVTGVADIEPDTEPAPTAPPAASRDVSLGDFETLQSLQFPAMEGATAALDGKIYAWGGYDYYDESNPERPLLSNGRGQVYDTATDTWSQVAGLPTPLTHAQAVAYDGKIYIFGGYNDGETVIGSDPSTYVYDPANDTITPFGEMPHSVSGYGLAQVGSRVYVISGMYGTADDFGGESRHMFSIDLADPDAGYRDEPDAPVGREHVAATVVDGKIYYLGGEVNHDQYTGVQDDAFVYDPATRQWTRIADLPEGGLAHTEDTTVTVGGKILVAGGNVNGLVNQNFISTIRLYDPQTDEWTTIGDLPEPRRGAYVHVIGDYLYVAGGDGDYPRNTLWRARLTVS